jgi:hypothetical protein
LKHVETINQFWVGVLSDGISSSPSWFWIRIGYWLSHFGITWNLQVILPDILASCPSLGSRPWSAAGPATSATAPCTAALGAAGVAIEILESSFGAGFRNHPPYQNTKKIYGYIYICGYYNILWYFIWFYLGLSAW